MQASLEKVAQLGAGELHDVAVVDKHLVDARHNKAVVLVRVRLAHDELRLRAECDDRSA